MALSVSRHKDIFNGNLVHNIWIPIFLKFKYRKKRRVNKVIKQIALIEDVSDAYVFCNNYLEALICKLSEYFLFISMLVYSYIWMRYTSF